MRGRNESNGRGAEGGGGRQREVGERYVEKGKGKEMRLEIKKKGGDQMVDVVQGEGSR